ncbi:MAG: Endonuclease V [uncultured Rubrobacteraceae bacterium]|uniref:Endonuclease V n=1 Tax=uncultured Rubrobacteraceae bacterium TaxID=349277 RepID=A0A6J4QXQ0_9ACTN|nr:MAG: Endonuclease V [uncultured Rubrobacteraceae bacterium]
MGHFPPPNPIGWVGIFYAFRLRGNCVRVEMLHSLDLSPREARRLQGELAPRVVEGPPLDLSDVRHIAGADVSTQGDRGFATVVVLSFPGLEVVEVRGYEAPLEFPYVPGLLAFREIPSVVGALERVETEVDALILDAHGLAHPRGMGLASHLGLFLDIPTVGCAKSRLVGEYEDPAPEKGSVTDLVHRGGVVGKMVRTRTNVSPVYVSVGNRIDLDSAVDLVFACCTRYRLPETTREAHNAANRLRRGEDPGGPRL